MVEFETQDINSNRNGATETEKRDSRTTNQQKLVAKQIRNKYTN